MDLFFRETVCQHYGTKRFCCAEQEGVERFHWQAQDFGHLQLSILRSRQGSAHVPRSESKSCSRLPRFEASLRVAKSRDALRLWVSGSRLWVSNVSFMRPSKRRSRLGPVRRHVSSLWELGALAQVPCTSRAPNLAHPWRDMHFVFFKEGFWVRKSRKLPRVVCLSKVRQKSRGVGCWS